VSLSDRRGFLKTILAAAASPSCGKLASTLSLSTASGPATPAASILESGEQQLRFASLDSPFAFQNFLRVDDEWKPATLPGMPPVTGPSFPLIASRAEKDDTGLVFGGPAVAKDLGRGELKYEWTSRVSAVAATPEDHWFRFHTVLHLSAPLALEEHDQVEPQIIVWLSSNSALMEGQSGSWRRVVLSQPTRNSLGTAGNDLPSVYHLDQATGVETMMYFDMSEMSWMSFENLPRFLVYRCSAMSRIERDGTLRFGIGLVADQATGNILPAGEVRFAFYLLQRPLRRLLTEQEAVARWMKALLPLFEEKLAWPPCATTWRDFAAGTVQDLQQKDLTQVQVEGHLGLRAYVRESSQIWKQPSDNFELMSVADVLWPSLLYLKLHPASAYQRTCDQLIASLPYFYHSDSHSISNDFVRPKDERLDSWYPFENGLIKYPMIGALAGSSEIVNNFLDAFETAKKMAQRYDYLFPIYYRVADLDSEGAGTNYAIGGLYAWAAILAHRLTREERYREEARDAVHALYTVPSERLFHEPQELAYGALAAAELGLRKETTYLLYQQLRMFYWYSDPSQKDHDVRGMVQAAASILYPAFKENVEAILPWTGILKRGIVFEGLLRFMDQQRRNNFYFFQDCSGDRSHTPMAYIPYENLGTLELGGQTGKVGKEIYGAGESLWMYLMFGALGTVSDRELMLVNLDLLEALDAKQFPPRHLNFLLYNPTARERSATISVPPAQGQKIRIQQDGKVQGETLKVPGHGAVRLFVEY
jgi:uncharacterized protein (DUF1810 family)